MVSQIVDNGRAVLPGLFGDQLSRGVIGFTEATRARSLPRSVPPPSFEFHRPDQTGRREETSFESFPLPTLEDRQDQSIPLMTAARWRTVLSILNPLHLVLATGETLKSVTSNPFHLLHCFIAITHQASPSDQDEPF